MIDIFFIQYLNTEIKIKFLLYFLDISLIHKKMSLMFNLMKTYLYNLQDLNSIKSHIHTI
jgi:hypothetical protein